MLYKNNRDRETEQKLLGDILGYFMPSDKAENASKKMIEEFGCIKNLLSSDVSDLCADGRLSLNTAVMLSFLGAMIKYTEYERFGKNPMLTKTQVCKSFVKAAVEVMPYEDFHLFLLDDKNKLIKIMPVSHGNETSVETSNRVVLDAAVKFGARGVIAVHTHPTAIADPSVEDIKSTEKIEKLFKKVGIRLVDHIIVGKNEICSMCERNML